MILNSINTPSYCNVFVANSLEKNRPVFTANSERAPFYPDTLETIDSIYRDYKKSLCETTLSDVKSTALKLSQETHSSKKEVLEAMQLVTQFSNMKSLKKISDVMSKEYLCCLGDNRMSMQLYTLDSGLNKLNKNLFTSDSGIINSLEYVLNKKQLAPIPFIKDGKIGVILDEEKISKLEEIKKTQPDEFNKVVKNEDLKYFYISGWDTGIPVVDRTKSLENTTRELLLKAKKENKSVEKVLDEPLLDRIKALGLKPTIIKNENPATELSVYNQMKPEQISKLHLTNIIEANSIIRNSEFLNPSDLQKADINDKTTKYIEDTLCVYTPEKMSQDLKLIHKKIMEYADSKGKDVLYIKPEDKVKSTDYVNYSYRKINDIDSSKFISLYSLKNYNDLYPEKPPITPDNTILVFLDDCAISGDSMGAIKNFNVQEAGVSPKYSLLFATLKGTDIAHNRFYKSKMRNPADFIMLEKINLEQLKKNKKLLKTVGYPSFSNDASTIVFPYMAPDNNSEFASNIALMHNLKYNSQNFSEERGRDYITAPQETFSSSASKTMSPNVKRTSAEYINIMGLNPVVIERSSENDIDASVGKKSLWEKLLDFIK